MKKQPYGSFEYGKYLALEYSDVYQFLVKYTIEKNLPDLTAKKVYDIGFATGFCTKIVCQHNIKSYTGIDISTNMLPYIRNIVQENNWKEKAEFITGDALDTSLIHARGPFDLVINCCAIYAENYQQLVDLCTHMYNNTDKNKGELLIASYHLDFVHTRQRMAILDQYSFYLKPILKENEKYQEFDLVDVVLEKPYFDNAITFHNEPVITQENLIKALKEVGYKSIEALDISVKPGYEHLFALHRAFTFNIYRCKV